MDQLPEYVIERQFAAPQALVWQAWTDPKLLSTWYGPGIETIIHQFDFEPGGVWHNEMIWGGNSNYSKMLFKEIDPPNKMVWLHHSCTDASWNDTVNPMMADWPRVLLTTVTFQAEGEKTSVRLSQIPVDASEAELECFAQAMGGMSKGWGSGFAIIDDLLDKLQAS